MGSFRKEKKYPLTKFELFELIQKLGKNNLKKLFPSRLIKSTYFDNKFLKCYHESCEGILPRKKYRIRCYPSNSKSEYYLEKKISSIEGSYKESSKITTSQYYNFLNNGIFDGMYGKVFPTINVFYKRKYFKIDRIRLTVDFEVKYKDFKNKIVKTDQNNVVELKSDFSLIDDSFLKLMGTTNKRFSKYCNGIELLNLR